MSVASERMDWYVVRSPPALEEDDDEVDGTGMAWSKTRVLDVTACESLFFVPSRRSRTRLSTSVLRSSAPPSSYTSPMVFEATSCAKSSLSDRRLTHASWTCVRLSCWHNSRIAP